MSFNSLCLSRNLSILSKLLNLLALSCSLYSRYPFNTCKNCTDVTSLIPDLGNLCLLFPDQTRGLSIAQTFLKESVFYIIDFLYCFLFYYFTDFHSGPYFFLMFALSSKYSFSSYFLGWKLRSLVCGWSSVT